MLCLSLDIRYRYLPCLLFDIWYRYLPCYTYYLISDTGTCHAMLITWYLTPVHATLYLTLDIWHRYLSCYTDTWYNNTWHLTCYHPVLVRLIRYCGTCIILHIHDYYFYGDLAWLLYCYQIFGTPVLLNSYIPEPLKKGDSWYYTPVNSRSWIIMVILYTFLDIIFG